MKIFVLISFLFIVFGLYSQGNLIYNGSFEEYYSCPEGNDLNNGQFELAKGWWKAGCTPDFFNSCNNNIVGVPSNFWGFQEAFDGNGYAGLVAVDWDDNGVILGPEYCQTKLTENLEECYEYNFSMHVALSNKSTHGVGRLGVYFGTDSLYDAFFECKSLNFSAQIENSIVIADTNNWTKISGKYLANGDEKYLAIGYFSPNISADTILLQNLNLGIYFSYLYLDSVNLRKGKFNSDNCSKTNIEIPNFITPNNDLINDFVDFSNYSALNPEIILFNRWGGELLRLSASNLSWNGQDKNGNNLLNGVYFYRLEYDFNNERTYKIGYIHLIRD